MPRDYTLETGQQIGTTRQNCKVNCSLKDILGHLIQLKLKGRGEVDQTIRPPILTQTYRLYMTVCKIQGNTQTGLK